MNTQMPTMEKHILVTLCETVGRRRSAAKNYCATRESSGTEDEENIIDNTLFVVVKVLLK